jgi:hypothetical protein
MLSSRTRFANRRYPDCLFQPQVADYFRIFEKSVNCVETLNGAAADVDVARFHWHIGSSLYRLKFLLLIFLGGIASFQAIMHILSELRNPLFDAPNRQRALRALQMSRILKENNSAKAWQAVKNMIDKAVSEHNLSPRTPTQKQNSYISPQLPSSTSLPINTTSNSNTSVYPAMGKVPTYAYQNSSRPYEQQQQTLPTQPEQIRSLSQPQPPILQSMQTTQGHAPCWDDMYETPT